MIFCMQQAKREGGTVSEGAEEGDEALQASFLAQNKAAVAEVCLVYHHANQITIATNWL